MPIGEHGYWAGSGWTLGGFNLVMDPSAYSFPVSSGTIWWDGSAGTRYFIDSTQGIITVIMAQVSPSRGGGFREDFTSLVDAAPDRAPLGARAAETNETSSFNTTLH